MSSSTAPTEQVNSRLQAAGYRVSFRSHDWVECFARRPGEHWLGRGDTQNEALEDLLQQMLPSHWARAAVGVEPESMPEPEQSSVRASRGEVEPAIWDESPWADTEPSNRLPTMTSVMGVAAVPPAPVKEVDEIDAPPTLRGPARRVVFAAEALQGFAQRVPSSHEAEGLVQLESLLQEIELEHGRFFLLAAERQRMHLLVWICRARRFEDECPGDHAVENAVQRIARQLADFGRLTWPGSVHALKVLAEPREISELFDRNRPLNSWAEAATRADQRLAELVLHDRASGCDANGWADAPGKPPSDPASLLEHVALSIASRLGPRDTSAGERIAGLDDANVEELVRDARLLRWLRGANPAPLSWGAAMGQLRFACGCLGARSRPLREVLDARTRPHTAWYVEDSQTEEPRATNPREALIAELPVAPTSATALIGWLERVFGTISKLDIARLVAPHREQVVALAPVVAEFKDRGFRRHMRQLIHQLGPLKPAAPPALQVEPELLVEMSATDDEQLTATECGQQAPSTPLQRLAARVREVVGGKRTLFVSNREDSQLEFKLEELMALKITWCEGSLLRVKAQCTRIRNGSYDLVLCASGFQDHTVVNALARATTVAGVPYVLVQRGRSRACVTAVAKAFNVPIG